MQIQLELKDEGVRYELARLTGRLKNLTPVMRSIGETVRRSVEKNFAAKPPGRPAWEKSKRAEKEGGQTLSDTGRLRRSFTVKGYADRVEIGTNVKYAAVHQLGFDGMVQVKPHIRRVRTRDVKEKHQYTRYDSRVGIEIKTGKRIVAKGIGQVKGHERHMKMPARPFLKVQDEDWVKMRTDLAGWVIDGAV